MNESQYEKIASPEGEDLLKGLYRVRNCLVVINDNQALIYDVMFRRDELNHQIDEPELAEKIGIKKPLEIVDFVLLVAGLVYLLYCMVNLKLDALASAGVLALYFVGRVKKNKALSIAARFLLTVILIGLITFDNATLNSPFMLVATLASIGALEGLRRAYNAKCEQDNRKECERVQSHNEQIEQEDAQLQIKLREATETIEAAKKQLKKEVTQWYPPDLCDLEHVIACIDIVQSGRAHTVQEMTKVYARDTRVHYSI